ncbi:hypothetical protein AO703_01820 [[Enterobacter] lignolyticus]|uniref:Uncharacterized protein n=1 Tax=[Enterobacter] lignolyticus TaxID=1334193 RepID=A0A806X292_9ENTR|nr:hypothetical protein AO703_01820 [[Enterobacter] lignolyticus]
MIYIDPMQKSAAGVPLMLCVTNLQQVRRLVGEGISKKLRPTQKLYRIGLTKILRPLLAIGLRQKMF